MNNEQLAEILKAAFPEADVAVSGQGGKFDLRIVDDQFEGKRPVARQQAVYAPLTPYCQWCSACCDHSCIDQRRMA